ncbi:hypothetical protein ACI1US_00995 [Leucobacter sp. BZR 635]
MVRVATSPLRSVSKPTPKAALKQLEARDGHECSWHGPRCGTDVLVPQHRQGGMGGSKTKHRASNLLWLCSLTNGLIESDADLGQEARERGIKVPFWADTTITPVLYPDGRWYLLDDIGGKEEHRDL